jgi:hypothetical protein
MAALYALLTSVPTLQPMVNQEDLVREFECGDDDGASLDATKRLFHLVNAEHDWKMVFTFDE